MLKIKRIVVLDLSEKTRGNVIGIRLADITTKRFVKKINDQETIINAPTVGCVEEVKISFFLLSNREATMIALYTCSP